MDGTWVLGINAAYHESAACLLRDGELVAAAEEERFNRVKHGKKALVENGALLPWAAIDACLAVGGIAFDELAAVGYSFDPEARYRANRGCGVAEAPGERRWGGEAGERCFRDLGLRVPEILEGIYGVALDDRFAFFPHHLCHLASAYHGAPFPEAALLSIDGIGEWEGTVLARGRDGEIEILESLGHPHSIGFLWEKLTAYLGFRRNHDECRVMGLAAYGDPERHRAAFDRLVRRDGQGGYEMDDGLLRFREEEDYGALEELFGPRRRPHEPLLWQGDDRRHADVAAALQAITEELVTGLARRLRELSGCRHLAMAGGVALNCVANGRVHEEGLFDDLWVQPAANDAGTALGAACLAAKRRGAAVSTGIMADATLGPRFGVEAVDRAIADFGLGGLVVEIPEEERLDWLARALEGGEVLGWFQGAMEFGPRALGNRSILADPRNGGMREILNRKVKHRELFRPFCPSVLAEEAEAWFELGERLPAASDHMLAAVRIRPEKRERIPAVAHVDGTSRIQRVHAERNPAYHALICAFARRTGVPLVLNTSFNDQEPIVCSPADALRCFMKTRIDVLALGPRILRKEDPS